MWVQRLAVVAHEAIHHVLADDFAASRQHAGHDRCIHVGDEALECLRGEDLWDATHTYMVLEADGLAREQSAVLAADGALPEPSQVAVLRRRRAITGTPLREQQRRSTLVGARLHERVQIPHS